MVSGLPKTVVLTSEEIRQALEEPLSQIIDAVKETLDRTPPELASDIMDRGIMLAGGGSLLQGLDERLREETQMPAHLAESPLTCVAVGSGRSLEEFEVIHRTNKNSRQPPPALLATRRAAMPRLWRLSPRVRRRRSAGGGQSSRLLVACSLILLTAYFGESAGGGLHSRPARRAGGRRARSRRARAARSSRSATCSAGSATRSTPRATSTTCASRARRAAQAADRRARGRAPRTRQLRRLAGARPAATRSQGYEPVDGARDRPVADHLVLDVTIDKGTQRRRARRTSRSSTATGSSAR